MLRPPANRRRKPPRPPPDPVEIEVALRGDVPPKSADLDSDELFVGRVAQSEGQPDPSRQGRCHPGAISPSAAVTCSIVRHRVQEETSRLCRLGYLAECELENRDRIAAAIHALLANIITDGP